MLRCRTYLRLGILKFRRGRSDEEIFDSFTVTQVELANGGHNAPASAFFNDPADQIPHHCRGRIPTRCIQGVDDEEGRLYPGPIVEHFNQFVIQTDFLPKLAEALRGKAVDCNEYTVSSLLLERSGEIVERHRLSGSGLAHNEDGVLLCDFSKGSGAHPLNLDWGGIYADLRKKAKCFNGGCRVLPKPFNIVLVAPWGPEGKPGVQELAL